MRHIIVILTVVALMVAMLAVNALPVFADPVGVYDEVRDVCRPVDPAIDYVCEDVFTE